MRGLGFSGREARQREHRVSSAEETTQVRVQESYMLPRPGHQLQGGYKGWGVSRDVGTQGSLENVRRVRFVMKHFYRTFVRNGVSTKLGQAQSANLHPISNVTGAAATLLRRG